MLVGSGWLFLSARRVAMRGYARCGGAARLVSCCWRGTFSAGRLLNEDAACVVHAGGIFDTIPLRLRAALLPARCVFASVAQGIEHRSPKAGVVRSNRIWGTTKKKQVGMRFPTCFFDGCFGAFRQPARLRFPFAAAPCARTGRLLPSARRANLPRPPRHRAAPQCGRRFRRCAYGAQSR